MRKHHMLGVGFAASAILLAGLIVFAQDKPAPADHERKVTEADVPPAALAALKKLAGGAAFTEFAEEVEHGHTFYEGSWNGPNGNVDAVVTPAGDLVVLEEIAPADSVPASVRAEVIKAAGKDTKVTFEKKTMVLYEVHFKKDGKSDELVFTPDARRFNEDAATRGAPDDDDKKGAAKGGKDEDDDDDEGD